MFADALFTWFICALMYGSNLFENVQKEVEGNKQKIYERLGV